MSALELRGVTFSYPDGADVLRGASLEVPEGAFALLVGATGSGKSTLLRLAKPEIAPAGELSGSVRAFGEDVRSLGPLASARAVGYVFQSPDAQVVCDTVWHEMAFGRACSCSTSRRACSTPLPRRTSSRCSSA